MSKKFAAMMQKKQEGATAVEYALLVVVIGLVMYIGAQTLGTSLSTKFSSVGNTVAGVAG